MGAQRRQKDEKHRSLAALEHRVSKSSAKSFQVRRGMEIAPPLKLAFSQWKNMVYCLKVL